MTDREFHLLVMRQFVALNLTSLLTNNLLFSVCHMPIQREPLYLLAHDGDLLDCHGQKVSLDTLPRSLMTNQVEMSPVHPITMRDDQLRAWQEFIFDHEIMQPFPQINRSVYREPFSDQNRLDRAFGNPAKTVKFINGDNRIKIQIRRTPLQDASISLDMTGVFSYTVGVEKERIRIPQIFKRDEALFLSEARLFLERWLSLNE